MLFSHFLKSLLDVVFITDFFLHNFFFVWINQGQHFRLGLDDERIRLVFLS
jgi:hypothetical protein